MQLGDFTSHMTRQSVWDLADYQTSVDALVVHKSTACKAMVIKSCTKLGIGQNNGKNIGRLTETILMWFAIRSLFSLQKQGHPGALIRSDMYIQRSSN